MAANAVQQQLVLYNNLLGSRASHGFYPPAGCCTEGHPVLQRGIQSCKELLQAKT